MCGRCGGCCGGARGALFGEVPLLQGGWDDIPRAAGGRTSQNSCLGLACTEDDLGAWSDAARAWRRYAEFLGGAVVRINGPDFETWPASTRHLLGALTLLAHVQQEIWPRLDIPRIVDVADFPGLLYSERIGAAIEAQRLLRRLTLVLFAWLRARGATPPLPRNMEETNTPQTPGAPTLPSLGSLGNLALIVLVIVVLMRR